MTYIGNRAFKDCRNITNVKVSWNSLVGLSIHDYAFYNVDNNITLWVPKGTTAIYANESPWMWFKEIKEYEPEIPAVLEPCEAQVISIIKSVGGQLIICGTSAGEKIGVYTISGVQVATVTAKDGETVIPAVLTAGETYIIRYGETVVKIRS